MAPPLRLPPPPLPLGRLLLPLVAACACGCLSFQASAELCVLVDVPHGRGSSSAKLMRTIKRTWATNFTFFLGFSGHLGPDSPFASVPSFPLKEKVARGLRLWLRWGGRWPEACSWVMKIKHNVYLNVAALASRLACFEGVEELQYLGTPKVVSMGTTHVKVAAAEGGIVLRRSLADNLPEVLRSCVQSSMFSPSLAVGEDVLLGMCLWSLGIELQTWLDPVDEAFFSFDDNVFVQKVEPPHSSSNPNAEHPWHHVITRFGSDGLSNMQCVLLVANLEPDQILQLHVLAGKSRRWFRNIGCVPGGIAYPEFTGAVALGGGETQALEPFFPEVVRTAVQQCFLERAFSALKRHRMPLGSTSGLAPASSTSLGSAASALPLASPTSPESKQALVAEWKQPQADPGFAAARLRRGGHFLCVFVLATVATTKHVEDAAATLEAWASAEPGSRPEGVEIFLVDRLIPGPEERVLRLRGDVDLGFLFNSVRAFYLWKFLADHHCEHCSWFMKVDADTLLNTWAVKERLQRYFNATEPHYLGHAKSSLLGSGRRLLFGVNSAIISQGLLRKMGPWLVYCIKDMVERRLGRGAEDIDLAYCLDKHGDIKLKNIGAQHEILSRGMARVASAVREDQREANQSLSRGERGREAHQFGEAGACTLWVHPVHASEMGWLHQQLMQLRARTLSLGSASESESRAEHATTGDACAWPAEIVRAAAAWGTYMKQTHADGWKDCWLGHFTWSSCCDPRRYGREGNPLCWDEEHNHERCCFNRSLGPVDLAGPVTATTTAGSTTTTIMTTTMTTTTTVTATAAAAAEGQAMLPLQRAAEIMPMVTAGSEQRGNPKCWDKSGFTFELCCLGPPALSGECWVWPYSHGFCCDPPRPPRLPAQVGGLGIRSRGLAASSSAASRRRSRSSRCREGDEEAVGSELLACSHSLDELGALFELEVSGTGDKASGWHDYLGAYERLLLHLPLSANVLELGVRTGLSLAMWSEYFPLGQIVGVDKNIQTFEAFKPRMISHGAFTRQNVLALQANASDPSVFEVLREANASQDFADLIIDDANHWAKDQLARFELLFPVVLRPGGVYIIEDVHIQAPYSHDGIAVRGYLANLSAAAYLTEDQILVGAHHIEAVRRASTDWRHQVESVTFMRDFVAITKAP